MKRVNILLSCVLLADTLSGCSALGRVFIARHERSLATEDAKNRAGFFSASKPDRGVEVQPPTDDAAAAPAIAAMAIPIVLDAVQKGIETESKRYKATYSGRGTGLLVVCKNGTVILPGTIRFQREAKLRPTQTQSLSQTIGVRDESTPEPVFVFDVDLKLNGPGLKLLPQRLYVAGTASKVAWRSLWPWQLVSTLVWEPWYRIDPDIAKVDMNVQVTIEAVTHDEKGRGINVVIGPVDFPLGKFAINDLPVDLPREKLSHLDSPYLPFPKLPICPSDNSTSVIPGNITATVMEANDLGDVIAKGAEKFKEEKPGITDRLKDLVGAN